MRWAKQYRRQVSAKHSILKKIERRGKMAKHKSEKKSVEKKVSVPTIPPEKYFVLCNGAKLKDIHELAMSMDHLDEKEFAFHVNEEKNDFANWIRDVFEDQELAEQLVKAKDMKHAHIALLKHVAFKR